MRSEELGIRSEELGIRSEELGSEGGEGIDEVNNKDISGKDDEVHQQAYAEEIAEAVSAGTIDKHVSRRAYGSGKTAADGNHKRNKERERLVAEFLRRLIHNRKEHGTGSSVGDKLGDERAGETDGSHNDYGVGAADIQNARSHARSNASFLYGETKHGTTSKDHQDIPIDSPHSLVGRATAEDEHGKDRKHRTLQQRHDSESGKSDHGEHDESGKNGAMVDIGNLFRVKEMQVGREPLVVRIDFGGTLQEECVARLQHHASRGLLNAASTAAYSHKGEFVLFLEAVGAHCGADERTAESDIGSAQAVLRAVCVVVAEDMMIGIEQSVCLFQLQQFGYLSGIDEAVASHERFVVRHGGEDFLPVETAQLDQTAPMDAVESQLADGHAYMPVVGGDKHFEGVVACGFEGFFG